MNCKYVMINGFLIKDIVNGKYNHKLMTFTKIGWNRYIWKCGNETLGVNISKKEVRFIKELLWQLSFVGMENKKLKALEIVKKRFTIQFCKSDLNGYYGIMQIGINPIYIKTQEEFDLLKEYFK